VAKAAVPHESYHSTYGRFASNAPVTDGRHVHAFFGSRRLYAYALDGTLVWQKDFGRLTMFMTFGEGAWTWLEGNTLLVVLDHEGDSFLVAPDAATGRERWRARVPATRTGRDRT
jgi:outer membrane protein assembly factor BamB